MNTYELDTRTLKALNLEVSDENREKHSALFLSAYNVAYLDICRNYIRPTVWEQVSLENRCFAISALQKDLVEILKVAKERDFDGGSLQEQTGYEFREREMGKIIVPMIGDVQQCWVKYEHMPEPLVNDTPTAKDNNTSVPSLIVGASKQIALCYFAAHMYYASLKKPSSAEYNYNLYLRICNSLKGRVAPGTPLEYTNTYNV